MQEQEAPYLEVLNGSLKGTQYLLMGQTALIGRGEGCDILLEGVKGVSRQHAQVMLVDDRLHVKDLGSQNGTSVDGKRVSEASIPSGSTIKVGQVSLRFQVPTAASLPAPRDERRPRRASSRRTPAKAGGGGAPAVAGGEAVEAGIDAQALMFSAGEGSRRYLLFVLFLVVLVIGALYAANSLLMPTATPIPRCWIVRAGEERVISAHKPITSWQVLNKAPDGSDLVELKTCHGFLMDAVEAVNKRNRINGNPRLYFLIVRGVSQGDAGVLLKTRGGLPIATVQILVRGQQPYAWGNKLTPVTARDTAIQLMREAELLQGKQEQAYFAWDKLRQAEELFKRAGGGGAGVSEMKNQCWRRRRRLESGLRTMLARRFTEALAVAFPDRKLGGKADLVEAYRQLEEVKRMAPDETSTDWQVVALWQAEIRKLLSRR